MRSSPSMLFPPTAAIDGGSIDIRIPPVKVGSMYPSHFLAICVLHTTNNEIRV